MERNDYLIVGIAVDEDQAELLDDWADEPNPEVGQVILLSDGLNNDYHIFGKIIATGNETEGIEWKHFDLILLSAYLREVAEVMDRVGIFKLPAQYLPIKLHILTHFH